MKKKNALFLLLALLIIEILVAPTILTPLVAAQKNPWDWQYQTGGPRKDNLLYRLLKSPESRLVAFEADEIDTVGLRTQDIDRIKKNRPDAVLLESQGYGIQALQMNVRSTVCDDTANGCPMSYLAVRIAFNHLIDREGYVIPEVLKGLAVPAYTLVPSIYGSWVNPNVKTYEFNIQKAERVLDAAGIVKNAEGKRIDPKTGNPMRTIKIIVLPQDTAPFQFAVLQHIIQNAAKVGLTVEPRVVSSGLLDSLVSAQHKYDAYLLGWSFGLYPTFVRLFWASKYDNEDDWNENGVRDAQLDKLLDDFTDTPDINKAREFLQQAQAILHDKWMPWAPIWTYIGVAAYSGRVRGIVLTKVPGIQLPAGRTAFLSNLNVHTDSLPYGGSWRESVSQDLNTLNPATYQWADESLALSNVYDFLSVTNPNDPYGKALGRLATSWSQEEIQVDGKPSLRITIKLVDNATFQDGTKFTSADLKYTVEELGQKLKLRRYRDDYIENMVKAETPDDTTIIYTIKGTSWLYLLSASGERPVPKHIFEKLGDQIKADISKVKHPTHPELTMLIGAGPFVLSENVAGSYVAETWYPLYYRRLAEKGLAIDTLKLSTTIYADEPLEVTLKISDYLKKPVTNATIAVQVIGSGGKVVKEVTATHTGDGVYTAKVTGLEAGGYSITVKASQDLKFGTLSRVLTSAVTVDPVWKRYQWAIALAVVVVIATAAFALYRRRSKKEAAEEMAPASTTPTMQ